MNGTTNDSYKHNYKIYADIKRRVAEGEMQRNLAAIYGISKYLVSKIVRGAFSVQTHALSFPRGLGNYLSNRTKLTRRRPGRTTSPFSAVGLPSGETLSLNVRFAALSSP